MHIETIPNSIPRKRGRPKGSLGKTKLQRMTGAPVIQLSDASWIAVDDIARIYGVSRSTVIRLKQRPSFPEPVKLGRLLRWQARDVEQWLRGSNQSAA
jgi:predicted DNA-binding transcriptional regulator AlpA